MSKYLIIMVVLLIGIPQYSNAAFIIKQQSAVAATARGKVASIFFRHRRPHEIKTLKYPPNDEPNKKGREGTLSFVFGFCGFIPLIGALFSLAAIVLGSIGLRKHQKHSLAGLLLGVGTITLGIILTILIIASMG